MVYSPVFIPSAKGFALGAPFGISELGEKFLSNPETPGHWLLTLRTLGLFYGGGGFVTRPLRDDLRRVPGLNLDVIELLPGDSHRVRPWVYGASADYASFWGGDDMFSG